MRLACEGLTAIPVALRGAGHGCFLLDRDCTWVLLWLLLSARHPDV